MAMISRREVVRLALEGRPVPYVPWNCGFTHEAWQHLEAEARRRGQPVRLGNHCDGFGAGGFVIVDSLPGDRVKDIWGVTWNRSRDKDIGVIEGCVLADGTLDGFAFPDPDDPRFMAGGERMADPGLDAWRVYAIGFSLFERAWTLRGMENLLMDFHDRPQFVHDILERLADFNIELVRRALRYEIDAVYFGDDWGQQHGLIMGPALWREFILPQVRRMYAAVRSAGKKVMIHSCGDVDELFDDLVDAGLDCFNPFQPEVMDVDALLRQYHGRLAFHGGLSTQRTLPYGTEDDVRAEVKHLLSLGMGGGYIFAPAHAVEGDVPGANMMAFLDELMAQEGFVQ